MPFYLMLYPYGNFIEDGNEKKSGRPDTEGDTDLICSRYVFHDLVKRANNQTTHYKAEAFIEPERKKDSDTGNSNQYII